MRRMDVGPGGDEQLTLALTFQSYHKRDRIKGRSEIFFGIEVGSPSISQAGGRQPTTGRQVWGRNF